MSAYDLNRLKGLTAAERAQLVHQGLIAMQAGCGCGNRIVDEGVQLIGCSVEPLPGGQIHVAYAGAVFCSRRCDFYLEALRDGLPCEVPGPAGVELKLTPALASRDLPPITWLDGK